MLVFKKLIYLYLTFLILLPFAAHAEDFGNVYLVFNQATVSSQIEVGKAYKPQLAVNEYPGTGFYFNNITSIDLYKTETGTSYSSGPQPIISVAGLSSADHDVKSRFENSSEVLASRPDARSITVYAVVKYTDNTSQQKTFSTNPSTYSVIASQGGAGTGTGTGTGTGGNTNNLTGTPVTSPQVIANGSISSYVFGTTVCTPENVVMCYIEKVIRLFIAIASLGSIVMIIIGGIILITSAGDTKKVATGRLAVTGAIIGLVIVMLSYAILQFVEKIVLGGTPSQIVGQNVLLSDTVKANSLATTIKIPVGVDFSATYSSNRVGTAVSQARDNADSCTTVTIATKTVSCQNIRSEIKSYYPSASSWGEIFSPTAGRTYYIKGIVVENNGQIEIYYKKTAASNEIFYDTWVASLSASTSTPTAPANPPAGGGNNQTIGPEVDPAITAKAQAAIIPTSGFANGSNDNTIRNEIKLYYPTQYYYSLKGIWFKNLYSTSDVSQAKVYYKIHANETVCHFDLLQYETGISSTNGYRRVTLNQTVQCQTDPNASW